MDLSSEEVPNNTPAMTKIDIEKVINLEPDENGTPLIVSCGSNKAVLYLEKLDKGSKGASVLFDSWWLTPNEFQKVSGRGTAKDWKRSIKHNGRSLKLLLARNLLFLNPPICKCEMCSGIPEDPPIISGGKSNSAKNNNNKTSKKSKPTKDENSSDENTVKNNSDSGETELTRDDRIEEKTCEDSAASEKIAHNSNQKQNEDEKIISEQCTMTALTDTQLDNQPPIMTQSHSQTTTHLQAQSKSNTELVNENRVTSDKNTTIAGCAGSLSVKRGDESAVQKAALKRENAARKEYPNDVIPLHGDEYIDGSTNVSLQNECVKANNQVIGVTNKAPECVVNADTNGVAQLTTKIITGNKGQIDEQGCQVISASAALSGNDLNEQQVTSPVKGGNIEDETISANQHVPVTSSKSNSLDLLLPSKCYKNTHIAFQRGSNETVNLANLAADNNDTVSDKNSEPIPESSKPELDCQPQNVSSLFMYNTPKSLLTPPHVINSYTITPSHDSLSDKRGMNMKTKSDSCVSEGQSAVQFEVKNTVLVSSLDFQTPTQGHNIPEKANIVDRKKEALTNQASDVGSLNPCESQGSSFVPADTACSTACRTSASNGLKAMLLHSEEGREMSLREGNWSNQGQGCDTVGLLGNGDVENSCGEAAPWSLKRGSFCSTTLHHSPLTQINVPQVHPIISNNSNAFTTSEDNVSTTTLHQTKPTISPHNTSAFHQVSGVSQVLGTGLKLSTEATVLKGMAIRSINEEADGHDESLSTPNQIPGSDNESQQFTTTAPQQPHIDLKPHTPPSASTSSFVANQQRVLNAYEHVNKSVTQGPTSSAQPFSVVMDTPPQSPSDAQGALSKNVEAPVDEQGSLLSPNKETRLISIIEGLKQYKQCLESQLRAHSCRTPESVNTSHSTLTGNTMTNVTMPHLNMSAAVTSVTPNNSIDPNITLQTSMIPKLLKNSSVSAPSTSYAGHLFVTPTVSSAYVQNNNNNMLSPSFISQSKGTVHWGSPVTLNHIAQSSKNNVVYQSLPSQQIDIDSTVNETAKQQRPLSSGKNGKKTPVHNGKNTKTVKAVVAKTCKTQQLTTINKANFVTAPNVSLNISDYFTQMAARVGTTEAMSLYCSILNLPPEVISSYKRLKEMQFNKMAATTFKSKHTIKNDTIGIDLSSKNDGFMDDSGVLDLSLKKRRHDPDYLSDIPEKRTASEFIPVDENGVLDLRIK